jgi:hypothetical protein
MSLLGTSASELPSITPAPPAKNIYEAISRVMSQVEFIQKQKSATLKYAYAGEAAIITELRPFMIENGIVMYCYGISDIETREYQSSSGTAMVNVAALYQWMFVHIDSGTFITVWSRGEASDTSDKATNKATTAAKKYALLQTFLLITGDDPDAFQNDERKSQSVTHQPTQAKLGATQPGGKVEISKWPDAVVAELVKQTIFTNRFNFEAAAMHSKVLKAGETGLQGVIFWSQRYRMHRVDMEPADAALNADGDLLAERERQKQDAAVEQGANQ